VFRHRPPEPDLNEVLPWLAAEKPEVFNAYQQTQGPKVEKAMQRAVYVASFIGHESGKALFIGLYSVGPTKPLTLQEYWQVPAYIEMQKFGLKGFTGESDRRSCLWFELTPTEFYSAWKGKLVVIWPGLERSWWRWADRNKIPVLAILEESVLDAVMLPWEEIDLSWQELGVLPSRWKSALAQWRGVYYIFDSSDGKGYVGSAYGNDHILGRWLDYAASGHGGNTLLRNRDARNFQFTILQRVSPDMEATELIRLEGTWKERLHTIFPNGLNEN
ncbi:MAG TPA: GIY-YIG nuclease family protein, partial [Bryobacteraceae bacterium]|jgi:hypothetical protein